MNQGLSANTNLSHYRILSKLGAGGMGEVYLAEDTRLERQVALKLLPAEFTQNPDRVRRFTQEAKAASALNHPNIITVYDIGECDAGRFIVMELVAGRTLRAVIAEDNSIETLLILGQQMAKALSAAHAAGITHRDIKPDNIMVRDDGYVKVLDFGLARLLPATASDAEALTSAQQTTPGQLLGTVAYMSPEQAGGQSVHSPSDIFALGVVLYELATGWHPFKAETLVGYLHSITLQTPLPLSQVKPEIPAALSALIIRMLAKDASQRPTADEVARDLLELERQGPSLIRGSAGEAPQMLEASVAPGSVDIAHVLFCDIVGYSALPIDRQKRMISALQEIVRQTEDYRRADSRGQLVRLPAGDGMALAFLQDPVAPVRCAIEIARALKGHPEIRLRIGVHSGPVFLSTDINGTRNVVGSGINIAQRVMDSGDAGHILVSRNVAEVLGQISRWQPLLHDLGEHEVKHGVRIHLFSIFNDEVGNRAAPQKLSRSLAVDKLTKAPTETGEAAPTAHTVAARADKGFWVAVLPFKWRGANADLEALAEGLTEDIVTGLSRFSYLRVIALSSTLRYAGDAGDVRAIGKELGARYVMEGSLRQSGSMLRVAVQLADASTGAHLWAETYNRTFSPEAVFELQDDLVPRIVSTVADQYGALVHSMSESLRGRGAGQYSAHEAVLRAFGYLERITPEEHAEVREILEAAVADAPNHSDCQAMLSLIYWHEYANGYNVRPDPLGRAHAAARQAVAAAPTNPLAHYVLATVLFFQKDFLAFRPVAERTLALNRMDASTTALIGILIAYSGAWEYGLSVTEGAMQLNPHHPGWYHLPAFYYAYHRRDYRGALEIALKVNMPGYFYTYAGLAAAYGQLGEQERAREALRELRALAPEFGARAQELYGKWFDAELTEHLIGGLRKAGLEIKEVRVAEPSPAAATTGTLTAPCFGGRPAIAVLPFLHRSNDPEQECFADGLAEDLITRLSLWRTFPVIARNSSFAWKGKAFDVKQVSADLGVRYLVEGSVRKSGNRTRIAAQLVDASTGQQVWAKTYDRELIDVFAVQDEISEAIAASLVENLQHVERARAVPRAPENLEAWELYQRALPLIHRFTPEDNAQARALLERAVALDRQCSTALARLAEVGIWEIMYEWADAPERTLEVAIARARRAVALDPLNAQARCSLSFALMTAQDGHGALEEARRAVELNPSMPFALVLHAYQWHLAGHPPEESIELVRRARALSPHDPVEWLFYDVLAGAYLNAGRFAEGLEAGRRLIALSPNYYWGYLWSAMNAAGLGQLEEARSLVREARRVKPALSFELARKCLGRMAPEVERRLCESLRRAGLAEGQEEASKHGG